MEKKKKSCLAPILLTIALGIITLVLVLIFFTVPNLVEQKRIMAAPPSIFVTAPLQGEQIPGGGIFLTRATASGINPITRIELWVDGELAGEQLPVTNEPSEQIILHADIPVEVMAGVHMLYWRAVDSKGQIGQSLPITIIGMERIGETVVITAEEGQTLGEDALPSGTEVTIPESKPAEEEKPQGGGPIIVDDIQTGPIDTTGAMELSEANPIINFGPLISFSSFIISSLPETPIGLTVGFEDCQVQLRWIDTADNEQTYNVWVSTWSGGPKIIATLGPRKGKGTATYTIPNPGNGYYWFWVEAVNGLGSQSSEYEQLVINNDTCPKQTPTELEIEIYDLEISNNQPGHIYCYISLEGNLYQQIQVGDSSFFNDFVKMGIWRIFLIPIPNDGEVTIKGECLSHQGDTSISLGFFNKSVPKELWDGSRLEARGDAFVFGFAIQSHASTDAAGIYRYTTSDLVAPEVIFVEAQSDKDPRTRSRLARNVTLKWGWEGNKDEITNFVIAWDDMDEYLFVGKDHDWEIPITLPSSCGNTYEFAVAAVGGGGALSPYSERYKYQQPDCELYAEVTFVSFVITSHDDNENLKPPLDCDEAELDFTFFVSSAKTVGTGRGEDGGTDTKCHIAQAPERYPFSSLFRNSPNSSNIFLVPIEPSTSTVEISAMFWDWDEFLFGEDTDCICIYSYPVNNSPDDWRGYYREFSEVCQEALQGEQEGTVQVNYNVRGFSTPTE